MDLTTMAFGRHVGAPAIGLRINALGPASIVATQEWYKIPRNDLAPRDGADPTFRIAIR